MGLLDKLASLGDRLGVLEKPAQSTGKKHPKVRTRTVTLAELTGQIKSEEVRMLAESPAELTVSFDRIFETAGIKPPASGWTIERLKRLLETDAFRGQERAEVQKRLLETLSGELVEPQQLIKDAVARDQALDAFEAFARRKMEERAAVRQRRLVEIESSIRELEEETARLKEQTAADQESWRAWRRQKRSAEDDLAATVGFLIDRPIISTEESDE